MYNNIFCLTKVSCNNMKIENPNVRFTASKICSQVVVWFIVKQLYAINSEFTAVAF